MKVYRAIDELAEAGIDPEHFWLCCRAIASFIVQEGLVAEPQQIAWAALDSLPSTESADDDNEIMPAAFTILDPDNFDDIERVLKARSTVFALQSAPAPSLN